MKTLYTILLVAALVLTTQGCTSATSSTTSFEAPAFTLNDLTNQPHALSDYRGQVVVIHFGTSWCPFCRAEDPHLEALHQAYKDRDVQVLVINVGEEDEKALQWKEEAGFSFPMLMDRDGAVSSRYAPEHAQPDLPRLEVMIAANLIIDRQGTVRFMSLLDTNNFDAKLIALRADLDAILSER